MRERLRSAASAEILAGAVMCARADGIRKLAGCLFLVFAFQTAGEDKKKLGTAVAISFHWYLKQQPRIDNDDDRHKNVFRVSFKERQFSEASQASDHTFLCPSSGEIEAEN